MSVLTVGSVALDTVKTPVEEHANLLGGSASYAALAASFFAPVKMVGVVGEDFPAEHIAWFRERGIDLEGLQHALGKTFAWSGEYSWDMNSRETRSVALNVFENFTPDLPASYRSTPIVLLANIAPALQHHVLDQLSAPRFTIADTMDLWIETTRPDLERLLTRVDLLILNDGEARQLTGETSLIKAGRLIREKGPNFVAIKKGEHGCLLFGAEEFFSCGAYPLEDIHDPTGAGDCFAGGLAGFLARTAGEHIDFRELRKGVVFGSVIASFNVEAFSAERLRSLTLGEIGSRYEMFKLMSQIEAEEIRG